MGLLDRIAPRRSDADPSPPPPAADDDPVFATKALRKFLTSLTANASPALLDLGPVVGSNVSFFGEQLGCKIFVEDIFADLDRHIRDGKLERLPDFLKGRFPQATGSVDGVLCWDLIDYLDKPSAQAVATELGRCSDFSAPRRRATRASRNTSSSTKSISSIARIPPRADARRSSSTATSSAYLAGYGYPTPSF
jgi:hypothetical protein